MWEHQFFVHKMYPHHASRGIAGAEERNTTSHSIRDAWQGTVCQMVSDGQRKGILIVDDSESDIELLRGLFASKDPDVMISVATNEDAFLKLVETRRGHSSIPNVDIVMIDFNMPRNDGVAVLKRFKSDPELRKIPVIVFSGSESEKDIRQAYELGANSYLVKPVAFDDLSRIVDLIIHFWLQSACLPNRK